MIDRSGMDATVAADAVTLADGTTGTVIARAPDMVTARLSDGTEVAIALGAAPWVVASTTPREPPRVQDDG